MLAQIETFLRALAAGLRGRPAQLPHGGHRLHRRPAPLGVRASRGWRAASTAATPRCVRHRELDARETEPMRRSAARPAAAVPAADGAVPRRAAAAEGVRGALPRPRVAMPAQRPALRRGLPAPGRRGRRRARRRCSCETVGVLAHMDEVDAEQAGILHVRCRGGQRFVLAGAATQRDNGLWLAARRRSSTTTRCACPARRVLPTVQALAEAIKKLRSQDQLPFAEPYRLDDAGWVANRWCELLPIPLAAKQKLMALDDPVIRLSLVDGFLRDKKVDRQLSRRPSLSLQQPAHRRRQAQRQRFAGRDPAARPADAGIGQAPGRAPASARPAGAASSRSASARARSPAATRPGRASRRRRPASASRDGVLGQASTARPRRRAPAAAPATSGRGAPATAARARAGRA